VEHVAGGPGISATGELETFAVALCVVGGKALRADDAGGADGSSVVPTSRRRRSRKHRVPEFNRQKPNPQPCSRFLRGRVLPESKSAANLGALGPLEAPTLHGARPVFGSLSGLPVGVL